jgi:ABC-type multidrug transport system fused ATPase/permease subunit
MADRIVVLDKGQIIETGTPAELLRANGYYARFFRLQQSGFKSTLPGGND